MARDPATAALALHRFGFGPRAGTIAAIAADPRGAFLADLDRPDAGLLAGTELPTSDAEFRTVFEFRAAKRAAAKLARTRSEPAAMRMTTVADAAPAAAPPPPRRIVLAEAKARIDAAREAELGFVERLVWFWSNHFCVSLTTSVMAGGYEREAIRPHVLGHFHDLLLAAESHPAMLLYLNDAQSIGPDSVAGINRGKGINENFAREILELHTLGVRTGYTQDDVIAFAKAMTGWSLRPPVSDPDIGGRFVFNPRMHEPGAQTVLGKRYDESDMAQGKAVLADLARNPATATHIAKKLAVHFVADDPPPALIDTLARRFRDTDGDLKEVAKALLGAPEAWLPQRRKVKRPGEWMVAALRATGQPGDIPRVVGAAATLGEPLWRPPAPKGFPDDNAAWLAGISERLAIANAFAERRGADIEPAAVLDTALGPLASTATRQAVAHAATRPQALTLALMSPEFLRR
ncbi:MAG TPA: DUF1800 domain-containing protein [Stellaceae bacterium]|nr:DUF1800 domain-containing protein [Stellaceae bacterium]